jgi:hypothetical protein
MYKWEKGEFKSGLIAFFATIAVGIVLECHGVNIPGILDAMGVLVLVIAFFLLISKSVIGLLHWIFGGK